MWGGVCGGGGGGGGRGRLYTYRYTVTTSTEVRSCVKSRWTSWAPVLNKPMVSVDVNFLKFFFNHL